MNFYIISVELAAASVLFMLLRIKQSLAGRITALPVDRILAKRDEDDNFYNLFISIFCPLYNLLMAAILIYYCCNWDALVKAIEKDLDDHDE